MRRVLHDKDRGEKIEVQNKSILLFVGGIFLFQYP